MKSVRVINMYQVLVLLYLPFTLIVLATWQYSDDKWTSTHEIDGSNHAIVFMNI